MIVKFFVSKTCPKCPKVKDFFNELKKKVLFNDLEIYDQVMDRHQFIFHDVMSVPTVIVCMDDLTETERYVGFEEIMNNKENIECLETR